MVVNHINTTNYYDDAWRPNDECYNLYYNQFQAAYVMWFDDFLAGILLSSEKQSALPIIVACLMGLSAIIWLRVRRNAAMMHFVMYCLCTMLTDVLRLLSIYDYHVLYYKPLCIYQTYFTAYATTASSLLIFVVAAERFHGLIRKSSGGDALKAFSKRQQCKSVSIAMLVAAFLAATTTFFWVFFYDDVCQVPADYRYAQYGVDLAVFFLIPAVDLGMTFYVFILVRRSNKQMRSNRVRGTFHASQRQSRASSTMFGGYRSNRQSIMSWYQSTQQRRSTAVELRKTSEVASDTKSAVSPQNGQEERIIIHPAVTRKPETIKEMDETNDLETTLLTNGNEGGESATQQQQPAASPAVTPQNPNSNHLKVPQQCETEANDVESNNGLLFSDCCLCRCCICILRACFHAKTYGVLLSLALVKFFSEGLYTIAYIVSMEFDINLETVIKPIPKGNATVFVDTFNNHTVEWTCTKFKSALRTMAARRIIETVIDFHGIFILLCFITFPSFRAIIGDGLRSLRHKLARICACCAPPKDPIQMRNSSVISDGGRITSHSNSGCRKPYNSTAGPARPNNNSNHSNER